MLGSRLVLVATTPSCWSPVVAKLAVVVVVVVAVVVVVVAVVVVRYEVQH